jgi:hypothetical protein
MFERRKYVGMTFYAPQTKILDGGTKRCVCVFEALFKGVSTRFGMQLIENSFKNSHATLCSAVQILRLGSIHFVSTFHHF